MYHNKTLPGLVILFEATLANSIIFKQPWDRIIPVGLMGERRQVESKHI